MIREGYIKQIGTFRSFKTQDGKDLFSYNLEIAIPYARQDGTNGEDTLIVEYLVGNQDYMHGIEEILQRQTRCEFTLTFFIMQTKDGRRFNTIKCRTIKQLIG